MELVRALLRARGASDTDAYYSRVTSSTQVDARSLVDAGARPPFAVVTDEQRQGRGRMDRGWVAPAGSAVLMTMVMARPEALTTVPLFAGVAVARALRVAGARVSLKWPNDIVFTTPDGVRKAGGIIAEVHGDAVLIGIGINVAMQDHELPVPEATSLSLQGVQWPREQLITEIIKQINDFSSINLDDYRSLCTTLGSSISAQQLGGGAIAGRALGIDEDGALLVDQEGEVVRVTAGDVFHVRAAAPQ